jgi:hypothetical protein
MKWTLGSEVMTVGTLKRKTSTNESRGTGSSRGAGERQSLFPAGAAVHHQEQVSETAGNGQRAIQINVKMREQAVGTGMAGGSSLYAGDLNN